LPNGTAGPMQLKLPHPPRLLNQVFRQVNSFQVYC
jgi:hypothetical protein